MLKTYISKLAFQNSFKYDENMIICALGWYLPLRDEDQQILFKITI